MNHSELLQIGIQKRNGEITDTWNELAFKHSNGLFSDGEQYRTWVRTRLRAKNRDSKQLDNDEAPSNYNETVEINKDGSQSSNKLVKMSLEDSKNPEYLLKAHGYNPNEWELISAKSKMWNGFSNDRGVVQLYASSITTKPKRSGFSFEKLLEEIRSVPPVYIENNYKIVTDKRLLELPFFDSHFGVSDIEYYEQTLNDTYALISSRHWEEILFVVGQDLLHNDDYRGRTANGTQIEKVDMKKAWSDALQFYSKLVSIAIKKSNKAKIMYSKGNHDESMSWALVQLLSERFPQVEVDDRFIERKCHTFGNGNIFIGITHGDKAKKNLHNLFQVEFPMEWARAKTREVHSGHLHTEDAKDWFGTMVRTLSTKNRTDMWHSDNGFVGAHKRFMLFEYNESELKSIHYV